MEIRSSEDQRMNIKPVPEMLRECAAVYEQRGKVYGDNYKLFGDVMAAMFPHGMTVVSPADWNRLGVFVQAMAKMTRYANQWRAGGHPDSLLDISVYTTMLRELDAIAQGPSHDPSAFSSRSAKAEPQAAQTAKAL